MKICRLCNLNYHNDGEDWIVVAVSNEEDAKYLHRVIEFHSRGIRYDGETIYLSSDTAVSRLV